MPGPPDKSGRRTGRGVLSSIDMLPPEAEADLVWALEALRANKLPQTAILAEFNERLADLGLKPISKGAWSRYSVRKAVQWRKMDERHQLMRGVHAAMSKEAPDEATLVLSEMIKIELYELLEAGDLSAKELNAISRTLRNTIGAQADTVEYRQALQDLQDRIKRAAEVAAEAGAKGAAGRDTLAKITELLTTGGH